VIKSLLNQYNIRGGSRDQHFLINSHTIENIVRYAELEDDDIVLEIGAGIGNLTEKIVPHVQKVVAVEFDPELVYVLQDRFSDIFKGKLEIISGDVLDIELPYFNKIVANLPYSISSPVTFKLLKYNFELAILMYQYEFAQRMKATSNTKDYSRLSVATQYFADVEHLLTVPPSYFSPQPKIRSSVLKLTPRPAPYIVYNESFFFKFITVLFGQRRKKIRNALLNSSSQLKLSKDNMKQFLQELDSTLIDMRAENLEPSEHAMLANLLFEFKSQCNQVSH